MFTTFEDILKVFNEYVERFGGEVIEIYPNRIYQIQSNGYSITHFMGDRDTLARFIVSIPLTLNPKVKFSIKKKTILNETFKKLNIFSELVLLDDTSDYYVKVSDFDMSKKLLQSCLNDYGYLPYLKKIDKAHITYANHTLSVYVDMNYSNGYVDDFPQYLNHLYELCNQTKEVLEFYNKKI